MWVMTKGMMASAVLLVALQGCGPMTTDNGGGTPTEVGAMRRDAAAIPPDGAIRISESVYMVPVSTTADGCTQYTPWSATAAVVAAIHYRRADGSFTLDRSQSECAR